jgi:hypothetical protein
VEPSNQGEGMIILARDATTSHQQAISLGPAVRSGRSIGSRVRPSEGCYQGDRGGPPSYWLRPAMGTVRGTGLQLDKAACSGNGLHHDTEAPARSRGSSGRRRIAAAIRITD